MVRVHHSQKLYLHMSRGWAGDLGVETVYDQGRQRGDLRGSVNANMRICGDADMGKWVNARMG